MQQVKSARVVLLVFMGVLSLAPAQGLSAAENVRFVRGELLVKFKPGVPRFVMEDIHRGVGARVLRGFRGDPLLYHVRIPRGWDLEKALAYYQTRADVQYAQPNFIYHLTETVPSDLNFSQQWGWKSADGADVGATFAWDKARGRFTVVVASIDTGVDYLHPDLGLNIWTNPQEAGLNCYDGIDNDGNGFVDDCRGWNFVSKNNNPRDDNNHGTHTSGILGALTNNGLGVAGANWDVQIMPVKFLNASGSGFTSDAVDAIDYAVRNGASILNNSWGGTGFDPALLDAIKRARDAGVLFVAAAGNSGTDNDVYPFYPCDYSNFLDPPSNIICVAATDANNNLAWFSNFSPISVHLGAPGDNILSTLTNQNYGWLSGTSMAAPHVAGAAALLKGCTSSLDYLSIKNILLGTARPNLSLALNTVTGGVVNYQAAIDFLLAGGTGACDPAPSNTLPVANPGGPYNANFRKPIQFNGTPSYDADGQILLYFWAFGDGTTGVGPRPVHQYATGGTYTVTLTVRDNLGGLGSKTTTANIRPSGRR